MSKTITNSAVEQVSSVMGCHCAPLYLHVSNMKWVKLGKREINFSVADSQNRLIKSILAVPVFLTFTLSFIQFNHPLCVLGDGLDRQPKKGGWWG